MRRTSVILVAASALAAGAAAFVATVATSAGPAEDPRCPLGEWLRLPTSQCKNVCNADPTFRQEAGDLRRQVHTERLALAALLEDPETPGQAILDQVDRVAEVHAALERRVAQHIIAIRPLLTPEQQQRLLHFCAEGVRAGCGPACPNRAAGTCAEPCPTCASP